jgi:predicted helicase
MNNYFDTILSKYRSISFSERDKGARFERLMKAYLLTDPRYANLFSKVWLWNEFPAREDFGGNDTGIDLVTLTTSGEYWAIQCKCFQEDSSIDKPAVDSFITTSGRDFKDINTGHRVKFSHRLWISTTNKWSANAQEAIKNQSPAVSRVNLNDLYDAPIDWQKLEQDITGTDARLAKKTLRAHQTQAVENTYSHFMNADRGKLIMACGTGKTFTSLRLAERLTEGNGFILFLVPSISLLGQTLNEWYADAIEPISAICICSDPEITKKRDQVDDIDTSSVIDLALPASTNVDAIMHQFQILDQTKPSGLKVVFSTYQSIEVIAKAQKVCGDKYPQFAQFDLIICDEAHRTTGVALSSSDEGAFTKVHNNDFIKAKKRVYMTATPRLYDAESKSKAAKAEAILCSMDDESMYGQEMYRIGFGEAVEKDLLTDYKVLILTLNEKDVPPAVQKILTDQDNEINTDDASKLIGCINALSKQILGDEGIIKATDPDPMRRAVAFCQSIVTSRKITNSFNAASDTYVKQLPSEQQMHMQLVESRHIDGTMNATDRDTLMRWLKEETKPNECRVLTNVRCLSEGVDVPSLDAVLFLSARNSQVDVVQSVGRVMRKSEGKNFGYIIIPILVPSDMAADQALDDNERYKVVWSVLNALRAHDDRFNATINKIELNNKRPNQIVVGGTPTTFDDQGNPVQKQKGSKSDVATQLAMQFHDLQDVVFARMVQKVGDRRYWEQWAQSVAEIAQRQIERITKLIETNPQHNQAFEDFMKGLHKNINPSISKEEAIDMLSQHIITKPVFDALFEGYSFVKNNAMSQAMQHMLDLLEGDEVEKDTEILQSFYESVKMRASGIDNAIGKQKIIIELYDKFFKTAFPKLVEKLGIVYTPVEAVDFIIQSVADVLKKEFGRNIGDENIHILDPFTGTGTFITRLIQSGLIEEKDLERKYLHEIHANEIVLLAYYIAAVNIENAYHDQTLDPDDGIGKEKYTPFDGIVLTDTFQLGETEDGERLFSDMFPQNSDRVVRQKKAPLRIIIGNPPYSIGQKNANDNAQNQSYKKLDNDISRTYAHLSTAGLNKSLYDAYIKAFRWSTDRLGKDGGIICFISNGAWLDGNSTDGFRKSLEREFSSIYVFNLRGNQRTSGELSRKEGGKLFGSGSRTPIAITLLVKNPDVKKGLVLSGAEVKATIYYHDIGDYLDRETKLNIIDTFKSFANPDMPLRQLTPNAEGDWISMRNEGFDNYIPIEPEKKFDTSNKSFFIAQSMGTASNRDSWVYNFSKNKLTNNIIHTIKHYNEQRELILSGTQKEPKSNPKDGSWTRDWQNQLKKNKTITENIQEYRISSYRPFTKLNSYFDDDLNQERYQLLKVFPNKDYQNLVIGISSVGSNKGLAVLISENIVDLHFNGDTQCFPLYYYEELSTTQGNLFEIDPSQRYRRHDAISDFIHTRAVDQYGKSVTKEDIFYYVYGFLHSPTYRETYANDLKKMLPRLPLVEDVKQFWDFSKAGRELAELHLHYEDVPPHPDVITMISPMSVSSVLSQANKDELEYLHYRVDKMRFGKKEVTIDGKTKKVDDKSIIYYNSQITIEGIPDRAYDYQVNGKSAIEWIMERYQVTTHKDSGITNNPNDWSTEQGKPRYILDLLLSIIHVSTQTVEIVDGLPVIKFE